MNAPRYAVEPRGDWVPPLHVVVDAATGGVVSRHMDEAEAQAACAGLNAFTAKRRAWTSEIGWPVPETAP